MRDTATAWSVKNRVEWFRENLPNYEAVGNASGTESSARATSGAFLHCPVLLMKVQRTVRHIPRWTCCEISSWNVNTCSSSGFIENLQTIYCATFRDWGVSDEAFAGASSVWTNDWLSSFQTLQIPPGMKEWMKEWRNEGMKEWRNEGMKEWRNEFVSLLYVETKFLKDFDGRMTCLTEVHVTRWDQFFQWRWLPCHRRWLQHRLLRRQRLCRDPGRLSLKSYVLNLWWLLSSLK